MTSLDIGIVVLYFAITIAAGIYCHGKSSKSIRSYFLGDNEQPWWMLAVSGVASSSIAPSARGGGGGGGAAQTKLNIQGNLSLNSDSVYQFNLDSGNVCALPSLLDGKIAMILSGRIQTVGAIKSIQQGKFHRNDESKLPA